MAETTQRELSDAQIVSRLRRRKTAVTVADLGLPARGGAARLRGIEGVIAVGQRRTGGRGRPATLWTVEDNDAAIAAVA